MSTAAAPRLMTTEEMLALPDNGMDRELIRGELRQRPMTRRNAWHASTEAAITKFLGVWSDRQSPRGRVMSGEAGFRLARNPDTSVGIDVVYVSPDVLAGHRSAPTIFDGVPTLAVEILSPSDTDKDVKDKIKVYKETGVAVVWIVDTELRTVLVVREGAKPRLFNDDEELSGEPELPGFRVAVAELFPF